MNNIALYLIIGLFTGGVIMFFIQYFQRKSSTKIAQNSAKNIKEQAEQESKRLINDAKSYADRMRQSIVQEEEKSTLRIEKLETNADERIEKREIVLEEKLKKAEEIREECEIEKQKIAEKEKEINLIIEEQNQALEKIAKLSKAEAEEKLKSNLESEIAPKLAQLVERKVKLAEEEAEEKSNEFLVQSIQRLASSVTSEATIGTVRIEDDNLKGKIIGREGRNINAFEIITGVDVIVDDTPGVITLSCYDTYRRYIAKIAMEELLRDGRIHPSSIEACVKKAQESADKMLIKIGKKAAEELNIIGLPEQIIKLIGRLRFRSSYGQNVLSHSMEVAWLAEGIALQIKGSDPEICKKAGLVHDIGKAVSHEVEGGHAIIGKDILEKFGIEEPIITAMKSHHEDFPYESLEARILQAADAISASRPGARRETLEKYIKRLKELENIASSFEGVNKVFAIQAGREVRVFVDAKLVDDFKSEKLSFDIARDIESKCEYPGEVKVAVYRETKFSNTAK